MNQTPNGVRALIAGIICCTTTFAAMRTFGAWNTLVIAVWASPLVLFFGSAVAYHYAPALTRNLLALSFVFLCSGSLLACWTVRTLELSRRNQFGERLIQLGKSFGNQQRFYPEESRQNVPADNRWMQYYGSDLATGSDRPSGPP